MPGFEQALDFPTHSDNLQAYRLETWNGFEFTTLHSQSSLETMLRPVEERIGWFLNELKHDAAQDRDWDINAHWMLYVDNYLEGFHIPFVYQEINDAIGKDGYTTECFEHGVLQIGMAADGDICFELPEDSIDYGKNIAAYYW